jgi:hypothetical protein
MDNVQNVNYCTSLLYQMLLQSLKTGRISLLNYDLFSIMVSNKNIPGIWFFFLNQYLSYINIILIIFLSLTFIAFE